MMRKRFMKLVMADRISRNEAHVAAQMARANGINYELAYKCHRRVICAMILFSALELWEEDAHDA